jgi:uncharacterized protein YjbJ (UPF0337 family)
MKTSLIRSFAYVLMAAGLGLTATACNTTKATLDTTVKFTSSTSPDDHNVLTEDGLIKASQKVNVYTAIVYDNLQDDMARGRGEYVASLGALLDVPSDRQQEWDRLTQSQYAELFPVDRTPSHEVLVGLTRDLAGAPAVGARHVAYESQPYSAVKVVNKDQFEGKWKQFKGELKKKWGKFTDDDMLFIEGDMQKFDGKVQERYGDRREEVKRWTDEWFKEQERMNN